jgi:mannose-1-phosphate guanylyltransferase
MSTIYMKNHYCVIMAGGIGSRFWPMSRTNHPKQFMDILGTGKTLLQQTYERFLRLCPKENIFIVTNADYKDLVSEQIQGISTENILLEPSRKNTAPCIAFASYKIAQKNPNAITVVAPSDHLILNENAFVDAINSCYKKAAKQDCLMTLGITPTRPDTGYGYIQFKDSEVKEEDDQIKKVKTFTEKPDLEMAKSLLQSGDFLWNSGIFIWSVKSIIRAFESYSSELATTFAAEKDTYYTPDESDFIKRAYLNCKNISIDYAIMEKATNVYVRISDIGWSDLGTWGSLYDHINHDENKNAIVGKHVMLYDSKNCIVNVPKDKLVVLQGLDGYIVVESDTILLICRKEDEQQIRVFVNDVKVGKGDKFA